MRYERLTSILKKPVESRSESDVDKLIQYIESLEIIQNDQTKFTRDDLK